MQGLISDIAFKSNQIETNIHQQTKKYYPNDLVQLLLSQHCASESGYNSDRSLIQPCDEVVFKDISSFKDFQIKYDISINDYMSNWRVLDIVEDSYTGYLGVIYINKSHQQLVLSHRSTNFNLGLLTMNIIKESGFQVDIKGCVMGTIQNHQGYGYIATKKVVDLILKGDYSQYSLSFTGHSLGAWLAELSVFYCHTDLKYDNVKAVTFDGPGSYDMMMQMSNSMIRGRDHFKPENLDIVTYLSSPNIVNCTNRHVGEAYVLPTKVDYKEIPVLHYFLSESEQSALLSVQGHHFNLIFEHFDLATCKPREYHRIDKWPCISHSEFGQGSGFRLPKLSVTEILTTIGISISESALSKVFGSFQNSTLGSMVLLFSDLYDGKLKTSQFWIAHKYLNIENGYKPVPKTHMSQFKLIYQGNYKVTEVNLKQRKVSGYDSIDNYLVSLKTQNFKGTSKSLKDILNALTSKYNHEVGSNTISINNSIQDPNITVENLREQVRELRQRRSDFDSFIKNQNQPRFTDHIGDITGNCSNSRQKEIKLIKDSVLLNKITVLNGLSGVGKTMLAKEFAINHQDKYVPILLNSSSISLLNESLGVLYERDNINIENGHYQTCQITLQNNQQNILFILDDVKELNQVSEFITILYDITTVKLIITTTNDILVQKGGSKIPISFINGIISDVYKEKLKSSLERISKGNKLSFDILKALSFINSPISKRELIKLMINIPDQDQFHRSFESLQKESFISDEIKGDKILISHPEIQRLVLEISEFQSLQEFVSYITTIFNYELINFNSVMTKISTFKCKHLTQLVRSLITETPQIPYNLNSNIILLTVISSYTKNNDDENIQQLKQLEASLDKSKHNLLQTSIDELLSNWPIEEDQQKSLIYQHNGLNQSLFDLINHLNYFVREIVSDTKNTDEYSQYPNVIILGNTGSAKSTTINGLMGNKLKYICEDVHGLINLEPETIEGNPIIGNNNDKSETKSVKPYRNQLEGITYWDCPGFLDTDGLLSDIQNIFIINSLNEVIQKYKNFSLMIVVDHSSFLSSKGAEFSSLLQNFSKLVSFKDIQDRISMVVSKSPKKITKDNIEYLFQSIYGESNNSTLKEYLKLFIKNSKDRIEIFHKPEEPSIGNKYISEEPFERINNMLLGKNVKHGIFSIGININAESTNNLTKLGGIFNKIAETLVEKVIVNDINNVLKDNIVMFTKGDLRAQIRERYSVVVDYNQNNNTTFFDHLKKISKEATTANTIEKISKNLDFFSKINSDIKSEILHWSNPINSLKKHYDKFTDEIKYKLEGSDTVRFESPIILISEINDFISKNSAIKNIWSLSYLCIVDQDLIINSGNVYIASNKFKIIGSKNIILKGVNGVIPSDSGKNGGNFYGISLEPLETTSNDNKLSIDVSGGMGKSGKFTLTIDERIKEIEESCLEIKSKLDFLKQYDPHESIIFQSIPKKKIELTDQLNHLEGMLCQLSNEIKENESKETLFLPTSEKIKLAETLKDLKLNYIQTESKMVEAQRNIDSLDSFCHLHSYIECYKNMQDVNDKLANINSLKRTLEELENFDTTMIYDEIDIIESQLIELTSENQNDKNYLQVEHDSKELKESIDKLENLQIKLSTPEDLEKKIKDLKEEINSKNNDPKSPKDISDQEIEEINKRYNQEIEVIGVEGYSKLSPKKLQELLDKYQEDYERISKELDHFKSIKLSDNLHIYNEKHQKTINLRKTLQLLETEFETNIIELTMEQSIKLLDEFQDQDNALKSALKSKQDAEDKFFEILQVKDLVIQSSTQKIQFKKKGKILNSYARLIPPQDHLKKITEERDNLKKVQSELSQEKIGENSKFMKLDELLKENYKLTLKDKLYSIKNDSTNKKNIELELNKSYSDLHSYWDDGNWFFRKLWWTNPSRSEILETSKKIHKKLFEKTTEHDEIKELLDQRVQFAEDHYQKLKVAFNNLEIENKNLAKAKWVMTNWKSKQKSNQQLKILFQIYDNIQNLREDIKKSEIEEDEAARKLLIDQVNRKESVQNSWEIKYTSSQFTQNLRDILDFYKQTYSFYQITGSKGGKGGNSGSFIFKGFKGIELNESPGENGENSLSLEGSYLNEDILNVPSVSYIFSIPAFGFIFGCAAIIINLFVRNNSGWIDGPYETQNQHQEKPSQNSIDPQISENLENQLNLYLSEIKDQINFIFPK